ncbi:delta-1-pyrroline-5-carboxylate dehydrogenase [Pseudohyphozyma bogoriensis]|nr:delta-1-pyrroline-5-carboxylate dehydrogenase [Pseudohyphozyma bogoriensis]
MKFSRFLQGFAALAVLSTTVLGWTNEDHEIFDIVSALESAEGKGTTFYSFMNVTKSATEKEISKSYRKRSLELHVPTGSPDKNPEDPTIEDRFARLGVIANILRDAEKRERYDFFYENGVPRWRGTGYYYSRYRPGLGTVLVALTFFSAFVHYIVLWLQWGLTIQRIRVFHGQALEYAWGPTKKPLAGRKRLRVKTGDQPSPAVPGINNGRPTKPGQNLEMVVEGENVFMVDKGEETLLSEDNVPTPKLSQTWIPKLLNRTYRRATGQPALLEEGYEPASDEEVEEVVDKKSGRKVKVVVPKKPKGPGKGVLENSTKVGGRRRVVKPATKRVATEEKSNAIFKLPRVTNEANVHYAPGSPERAALLAELASMEAAAPYAVPAFVGGKEVKPEGPLSTQPMPHNHKVNLATFATSTPKLASEAIDAALGAKSEWEAMTFEDRAAIFLKAADLISTKYRAKLCAATMLGQGKNAWQAEIDAAAELCDFLRFGVQQVSELYSQQPPENAPGVWNRVEYRALEGFVFAVSPFNFTAIGGNLVVVPALVGNVVVWKPSPMATYSSWVILQILHEAGLPKNVIQFLPTPNGQETIDVVNTVIEHRLFAGLHFTGSTHVFRSLWKSIGNNLDKYLSYPRLVGETGGKNWQLVHESADVKAAAIQAIRGAYEYQGQKCSALARLYVPQTLWSQGGFKDILLEEVAKITVGPPSEFEHYMGPVISKFSYDKIISYIEKAKAAGGEVIAGGSGDDSKGYYVQPTVIVTKDPKSVTMVEEIFGPVLTVYVYEDDKYEETCKLIDGTTQYALTGALWAQDRTAIVKANALLRNASGMFYINDKSTGAVVGQQPFGGARGSGTNDKAGSMSIYYRFVQARSIKESYLYPGGFAYPSNLK